MSEQTQKQLKNIADSFRKRPRRYVFIAVVLFWVVCTAALFWPRDVTFRYDAKTCFYQPTVLPQLLESSGKDFRLEADQVVRIGEIALFATKMCAVPVAPPSQGVVSAQLSIKGWIVKKVYTLHVTEPPKVIGNLNTKPIPLSKDLTIRLNQPDLIYSYRLVVADKSADCHSNGAALSCELQQLQLAQGQDYQLHLERYFATKKISVVTSQTVHTLEATNIVGSSIKMDETVFSKPTELILNTDKEVAVATVQLYKMSGSGREPITTSIVTDGKTLKLRWQGDLPRMSAYELDVASLTGKDGSGLGEKYRLGFRTSGGPKVTNVSIGTYKVALGATAVLTFDQPLQDSQDISGIITASGGARILSKSGNKVTISFAAVPRCSDVTIKVSDDLKSNYDISGGTAWGYSTRTICQVLGSIGTSVKGRSMTSYTFGDGPNTVLFTGAIHGSEASTRALMLRWVDELEVNAHSIPSDKTVVVIPAVNPDGFVAGSRTNANNVDLNRNFATADWKSDITTTSNAPFPGGGGKSSFSEPESQALANYVGRVRPRLVLSYHSIGGLLAANQAGDSGARANTYASLSGYRNTTGASDTFEYGISGTADDYYAEVYGVPSLLIELGSHTDPQFSRNQKAMWAMLK